MEDDGEGACDDALDREAGLEGLAKAAGAGDRAALDRFLHAVHGPVVRYCRAKMNGSVGVSTADDVVQDVLLAVCSALPRYRPTGSSVMAFVFGIARFKIADTFRAAKREPSSPSEYVPDTADLAAGPDLAAVLSTETARLKEALGRLPEHHREVIVLRIALGYSADEVARATGSTAGAVRVTQHRAVAKLRSMLAEPVGHDHL